MIEEFSQAKLVQAACYDNQQAMKKIQSIMSFRKSFPVCSEKSVNIY